MMEYCRFYVTKNQTYFRVFCCLLTCFHCCMMYMARYVCFIVISLILLSSWVVVGMELLLLLHVSTLCFISNFVYWWPRVDGVRCMKFLSIRLNALAQGVCLKSSSINIENGYSYSHTADHKMLRFPSSG